MKCNHEWYSLGYPLLKYMQHHHCIICSAIRTRMVPLEPFLGKEVDGSDIGINDPRWSIGDDWGDCEEEEDYE